MPSVDDLSQSNYLKQNDVEPAVDVTITGWREVTMKNNDKPDEQKYVLDFAELDKPLTLNQTNGKVIEVLTGTSDFNGWAGKRIQLYKDPLISYGGKITGGIRVRQVGSTIAGAVAPQVQAESVDDIPF
jgi:hypothetical protein